MSAAPLLRVEKLSKEFAVSTGALIQRRLGAVKAVDQVSLEVTEGETLGVVGESGCGKSTLGRLILRLIPATSGRAWFRGIDLFSLGGRDMRALRTEMQVVFQDPQSSLNPRMTVGDIVAEPLAIHRRGTRREIREETLRLLDIVGLPEDSHRRYPHEFSGGQRQRVGIARAIALKPKLIIADEPVSALDVSVQAGILNLLRDLQKRYGMSYLFISHDLAVVRHMSDRIAVMYKGRIVETAASETLFKTPRHPYTETLLNAHLDPFVKKEQARLKVIGEIEGPEEVAAGCPFRPRCHAPLVARCETEPPLLEEKAPGHFSACHLERG